MSDEFSTISVVIDDAQAGWRLDRALAAAVPTMSRERLKALISGGHVRHLAGVARDPAMKTDAGLAFDIDRKSVV